MESRGEVQKPSTRCPAKPTLEIAANYVNAIGATPPTMRRRSCGGPACARHEASPTAFDDARDASNKVNTHEDIDSWIAQAQRRIRPRFPTWMKEALSKYPEFYKERSGPIGRIAGCRQHQALGAVASALGSKLIPILSGSLGAGVGSYSLGSLPLIGSLTAALSVALGGVAVSAGARASRGAAATDGGPSCGAALGDATGVKIAAVRVLIEAAATPLPGRWAPAAQQSTPGYCGGRGLGHAASAAAALAA